MNIRIPTRVAGAVALSLALGFGSGTASAAGTAGALDTGFGNNGIVLTNLGLDANGNQIQAIPTAVAEQSTGDIVVAVGLGGLDSGLVRYLPNGTRDTTFGNGGFAALPALGISSTRPALAVQLDGKLVRAAGADRGRRDERRVRGRPVQRQRHRGSDLRHWRPGHNYVRQRKRPGRSGSPGAARRGDPVGGPVLFGGRPPRDIGGLARFNSNGSIDTAFGSGGQELVPNSNPVLCSVIGVTALGLDANGDIFTLPSHLEFSPAGQPVTLTPAAITTTSLGGNVVFLPSGGFVVATTVGTSRSSDHDIQVTRFNPDGTIASTATGVDYAGQNGALAARDVAASVAI